MKFASSARRGFTLIELLVVIAIIGILSAVVLASLNTARQKGSDAAIKSDIDNSRAQAELYYDSNINSYAGVCAAPGTASPAGINQMLVNAQSAYGAGTPTVNAAPVAGTVQCNDSQGAWAASAPLKASAGSWYCVDNTGKSKVETGQPLTTSTTYICP